jgi:2-dehydro-3-deoxyphosphogluconate aldolase/(4S)-4-hydroxy-2-oxoglutarate aldolase
MPDPFSAIASLGVVPVIAIEDARDAVAVAAVGGAWIARAEDIRERRFAEVAIKARAAIQRAAEIRGGAL